MWLKLNDIIVLAAIQLGSKWYRENQDKFVLCQAPCFTEEEDSLRQTNSLAVLNLWCVQQKTTRNAHTTLLKTFLFPPKLQVIWSQQLPRHCFARSVTIGATIGAPYLIVTWITKRFTQKCTVRGALCSGCSMNIWIFEPHPNLASEHSTSYTSCFVLSVMTWQNG